MSLKSCTLSPSRQRIFKLILHLILTSLVSLGNRAGVVEHIGRGKKSYIILVASRSYHGEERCNKKEDSIITTKHRITACNVEVLSPTNHTISAL